jgi:hypothetical protein
MSPSEDQLRAALRAGEGPAPSADAIIGHALGVKAERRQQRVRALGMVAAVAAVAGLGAGIATSSHSHNSNASGSAKSAAGSAPLRGADIPAAGINGQNQQQQQQYAAGNGAGGAGTGGTGAGPQCPAKPVQYALPGGGGTNQFGASDSLFSGKVQSILMCRYTSATSALSGQDELMGSAAQDLATRIDSSTTNGDGFLCKYVPVVELVATGIDGKQMTPISVSGGCGYGLATNGTGVRYVPWSELQASPPPAASPPASGVMSGSPVH